MGILGLHAVHLRAHQDDAVLRLRHLYVQHVQLPVDVIDKAGTLANLFLQQVELLLTATAVLLGFGQVFVELFQLLLHLCLVLLQLGLALRLRRKREYKEYKEYKECRTEAFVLHYLALLRTPQHSFSSN